MDDTKATGNDGVAQSDDALREAEQLLAQGQATASFDKVRSFWLKHPADPRAPQLLSKVVKESGRTDLSDHLARLSDAPAGLFADPQLLFDAGYQLIEARQFHLAIMLLEAAVKIVPDEPTIRYELGFALMAIKRFADAIPQFDKVVELAEDFDSHLNLSVCYTMTRNGAKSKQHLDRLLVLSETTDTSGVGGKEEIQKELANRKLVLRRLELMAAKPILNGRDWFFILYGGLLLEDQTLAGMAHADTAGGEMQKVAESVVSLRGAMEAIGLEFDMIEYYSASARPLAEAIGRLLDLPVEPISDFGRSDRTLLCMAWGDEIIECFRMIFRNDGRRVLFTYGVPRDAPLPVTPDIVAHVMPVCDLPWHQELLDYQARDDGPLSLPDEAMAALVDQLLIRCSEVECRPDVIRHCQDLTDYFAPKRNLLIAGNHEVVTERPEYTAEQP